MENLRDLRVQFMLSPQKLAEVEDLMRECGVKTKQELFNNALTLLQWAVAQVQSGRSIASVDEREKRYRELQMPILTAAATAGAPRTREHLETRRRNRAQATHARAKDD
jgi:hypothetical protein